MSVTVDQRTMALRRANEIRSLRADLKRRLKTGETNVASVLSGEIPDHLASMRVGELLESLHLVGHKKSHAYLARVGNLSYTRRLDRLTARQKFDLLALLAASEEQTARKRAYNRSYEERHG